MAKSSKKLKIGYVQDTPVSTSMISNECMICHMKVHIVSYNLDQKKISKSKIHILPNYEQTDLKTAIVMWSKVSGRFRKIFVAFSEYMNFNNLAIFNFGTFQFLHSLILSTFNFDKFHFANFQFCQFSV